MRTRAIQLLTPVLCITVGGGAQASLCSRFVHDPSEQARAHACCPSDSSPAPRERCYECEPVAAVPMASTTVLVRECALLMTIGLAQLPAVQGDANAADARRGASAVASEGHPLVTRSSAPRRRLPMTPGAADVIFIRATEAWQR